MEADAPLEEQVAEFERSGFICLLNALPPETVSELIYAVDASRAAAPESWDLRGPGSGNGWREPTSCLTSCALITFAAWSATGRCRQKHAQRSRGVG